jgi:iron(III) transport system substrate-binding protein
MTALRGGSFIAIGLVCFAPVLGAEQVVVCCSMKEDVARPVADRFEGETGTKVTLVPVKIPATSEELVAHLTGSKRNSRADLFWSSDPVAAMMLKSKGLSAPYESPNAKAMPAIYSDPEHHWTGFAAQARIIIYNKNLLPDPEQAPTSVFDLMNPRFNRRACIANPSLGTTSMHAAALFQVLGTDMAELLFNSFKTNKVTMVSSNLEVMNRVAAGDFAFGFADTEDFDVASKQGQTSRSGIS